MHNYNIAIKGEYAHKQTSDFLKVVRYLILRKKHTRYLLLDFENLNANKLTAVSLQIDQYDARGNSLGVVNVSYDGVNAKQGRFVLQQKIEMHRACVDFFVKVVYAEYGDVKYCLGDNDTYVVYDKKVVTKPVTKASVKKEVGEDGHVSAPRVFSAPKFLRFFSVVILVAVVALTFLQLMKFKQDEESFFLSNVLYEFATDDRNEGADVVVTGYAGYGGGDLVIPSSLEGYNVVKVKADAFRDNNIVRTIKVDGNVIIEDNAFAGCNNLRSIELNGVENVGVNAFYNCVNVTEIKINDCLNIGASAFEGCSSVAKLTVNSNDANKQLQLGKHAFAGMGYVQEITLNQYVRYDADCDYFYNTNDIDVLKLKNYNYSPCEADSGLLNKPIRALFGDNNYVAVRNLTIEKMDTVPASFTSGISQSLESVTFSVIDDGKIGNKAFEDCFSLKSFTSPEILEVGEYAFSNTSITSFNASQLSYIGNYAFANCKSLIDFSLISNVLLKNIPEYAFLNATSLKEVYIPEKIQSIGNGAYSGSGLVKLTFATNNAMTGISNEAFKNCTSLSEVSLPKKLETISDSTFEGCVKLAKIELPSSVTAIGTKAFSGCESLGGVNLPNGLTAISAETFSGCTSLKEVVIPKDVTEIGVAPFKGCYGITSLTVPFLGANLETPFALGYLFGASDYTIQPSVLPTALTSVKITDGNVIPDGAFFGCTALNKVDYPANITSVGANAFYNCNNLRFVSLPESLQSIGETAFVNCYKLFEVENYSTISINVGEKSTAGEFALAVYTSEDAPRMEKVEVDGFTFGYANDKWYLMENAKVNTLVLPSLVNESKFTIPSYFYYDTAVEELVLSSGIEELGLNALKNTKIKILSATGGDFAFAEGDLLGNYELITVDFSTLNITEIANNLFENNTSLKSVVLPNNVVKIGNGAFRYCSSLTDVVVPQTVEEIGDNAFDSCYSLTLNFENLTSLKKLGLNSFNNCIALTFVNLPYGIQTIGDGAFSGCTAVSTINLPSSVESIGSYVFSACSSVTNMTVPYIGANAYSYDILGYYFGTNESVYQGMYVPYTLTTVTVTNTDKIGANAFANLQQLTTVTIPNNVTEIGDSAFYYTTSLSNFNFPSNLKTIGNYAFANCSQIKTLSLPNGVESIGERAFENLTIDTFTAPSSLNTIGGYAFYNCDALTTAYLNGVETIGGYAFYNCEALTTVSLTGVKYINEYAFAYNGAIKEIILPPSLISLGAYAFENCYELSVVTFSFGILNSVNIASSAFSSCKNLHQVYDLTRTLGITVESESYGGVAYNALVVNTTASSPRLVKATINGLVYKYADNVCAVVGYDSSNYNSAYTFSAVTLGGKTYNSYIIARNAFEYCYSVSKITVTSAVKEIKSYAFNGTYVPTLVFDGASVTLKANTFTSGVDTLIYDGSLSGINSNAFYYVNNICYDGSKANWNSNVNKSYINSNYRPNYYYSDCIHEHNYGEAWNYDSNGYVNYYSTSYSYRELVKPGCETTGTGEYYCDKCNYSRKITLDPNGHYFVNYACQNCDAVEQVYVDADTYNSVTKTLITVRNDATFAYDVFSTEYDEIHSTNVEAESESTFTITAKRAITVKFKVALSKSGTGTITIVNGKNETTYSGTSGKTVTFDLNANETIIVKFARSAVESSDCYAKITNIQIS